MFVVDIMAAVRRKIEKDRQDARWLRWTTRLTHTVSKRLSRPSQKDAESLRRSESREVHLRPAPCALRPPCVVPCALRYASPSLLSAPARGALRHTMWHATLVAALLPATAHTTARTAAITAAITAATTSARTAAITSAGGERWRSGGDARPRVTVVGARG